MNLKLNTTKKPFCYLFMAMLLAGLSSCSHSDPEMLKYYRVYNRLISPGKDAGSIHLNDSRTGGVAWIKGKQFKYGTIEFDIKGKDEYQASFVGIAFHGVSDTGYEVVYFRPFNFRAADPERKAHSVQYIVVPNFDWSVLRQEYPGVYEQPISPAPDPNAWLHARIVVGMDKVSVYVNGHTTPALSIKPLVQTQGEMIGLWVGSTSDGDWKNIKITAAN